LLSARGASSQRVDLPESSILPYWIVDKFPDSGHHSTMAMTMLLTEGYTNLSSLKGGFGGWVEAGFPVAEYAAP
jgi:hypothetical protein